MTGKGNDSVAAFAVAQDGSGRLTRVGEVAVQVHPRHLTIDPSGRWMLVSSLWAHRVEVFEIGADGMPRPGPGAGAGVDAGAGASAGAGAGAGAGVSVPSPTHALFSPVARL